MIGGVNGEKAVHIIESRRDVTHQGHEQERHLQD